MNLKRVAIIGSGGAGKTTLTRALSERTGLPVVHLDKLYWEPGWVASRPEAWQQQQAELLGREGWIIDGNYGATLDARLAAADTVIFLDTPRLRCLWHLFKRHWRYHRRVRPDMTEGCEERLTGEFLRWVWHYPDKHRPEILRKLRRLESKRIVQLRGRRQIEAFLRTCPGT